MNRRHDLKTAQPYFNEVWNGRKRFEVRKNDRDFKTGDVLMLHPLDESGRVICAEVHYVLSHFAGVEPGFVVMSLGRTQLSRDGGETREPL